MVVDLFNSDPQPDSLIGRKLDGRYEMLGRLGEGGVGVVYRARQVHLGREVAIKVLHKDAAAIPEWRRRFEREAQALSALAHPNVVPVTDSGIDNGVPFLVMELLQGKTLADLLKEGPLPLWRALDIARQLLRGLAFAHGKGIVHRDLKPANVFLQELPDQADHVRLLDFGMVKFLEKADSGPMADTLTRAGVVFGTPAYLSPEQAKGGPADARTDVYAAGCVLFQLLSGRRPFIDDTYEGVVMAHLTQPVPSLLKVRPGLAAAAAFQPVVEKSMAKKPSARFKDADAMLNALEAVITKLPAAALKAGRRKPTPRPLRVVAAPSRFWRRALMVVAVGMGVGAAAVYLRLRHDSTKPVETAALPAKARPKSQKPTPPALPAPVPPRPALPAEPPPTAALPTPPVAKAEPPAPPPAKAGSDRGERRAGGQAGADGRAGAAEAGQAAGPIGAAEQRRAAPNACPQSVEGPGSHRPPAVPRQDQPGRAHVAEGASPPLRLRARQSGRRAALAFARTRLRSGRLVQRFRGAVRPGP